jgi:hypothetical protein
MGLKKPSFTCGNLPGKTCAKTMTLGKGGGEGTNWGLLGSGRVYLAINPIGGGPSLYTEIDKGGWGRGGGVSVLIVLL